MPGQYKVLITLEVFAGYFFLSKRMLRDVVKQICTCNTEKFGFPGSFDKGNICRIGYFGCVMFFVKNNDGDYSMVIFFTEISLLICYSL